MSAWGGEDEGEPGGARPPRAGRREWIGLGVVALPCLLYAMDLTVLHLAVPSLARELQPSSAQLLWIIDVYGVMVAGALVTWARSETGSGAAVCCWRARSGSASRRSWRRSPGRPRCSSPPARSSGSQARRSCRPRSR